MVLHELKITLKQFGMGLIYSVGTMTFLLHEPPAAAQEELIQVKHGDNTRMIEIYQGNKVTLPKLE